MAVENMELIEKYGKPLKYDREFKGPSWRNRGCTDVPCLLIFVAFVAGWAFVGHYAIRNGDLNKLMVPTNSLNQKCGIDSQVLNKKYLFYFDLEKCIDPLVPLTGCSTKQVCVEQCPQERFVWEEMKGLDLATLKRRLICVTDADRENIRSKADIEKAIAEKRCASWYMKSEPLLNRCMWTFSETECSLLPNYLLSRIPRFLQPQTLANRTQMHALAMTLGQAPQPYVAPPPRGRSQEVVEEPINKCSISKTMSETVKSRLEQTGSRLAKFIGNIVQHFTNDSQVAQEMGEEIVEDIVSSAWIVMVILLATMVVSLIFIALMRWLASPLLWVSIVGVHLGLIVAFYFSIQEYRFYKANPTVPYHSLDLNSYAKNLLQDAQLWLYLSIFLGFSFVVIFLMVIVLRTRIRIATAIIKEGSKAVTCVQSTMFFPIFSWLLFVGIIFYAVAAGLYLGSIGESSFRMIRLVDRSLPDGVAQDNCVCQGAAANYTVGEKCDPQVFRDNCYIPQGGGFFGQAAAGRLPCTTTSCSFSHIEHPTLVTWFIVYNVFGFFWLLFFVSAFSDMVLAATFATWYWTFKKRDVPYFTLTRAFRQTAFYHLGTVAFGSLILAICRMIRLVLEYIDQKLKRYDNEVTRAIMCCMKCFFWLLETFLRFLNRNAYIMCAIHGTNFCSSAQSAFNLIMRNFLRVITIDKVTDLLFFLSKVLLTATAGVATYYYLVLNKDLHPLHYYAVPTALVVVPSYLITSVFFSVYSMAVDTLFLCFLEDCERNDGSPDKPYYMSKQLMRILGTRNKMQNRQSLQ